VNHISATTIKPSQTTLKYAAFAHISKRMSDSSPTIPRKPRRKAPVITTSQDSPAKHPSKKTVPPSPGVSVMADVLPASQRVLSLSKSPSPTTSQQAIGPLAASPGAPAIPPHADPAPLTNQQPSAFWHGHALLCYKLLTGVSVTIRRVKFIGNRALCSRPSAQAPPASIPSTHDRIQQHQSARGALDSLIFHLVSGSSQPNHANAPSSIFSIAVRCFAVTAQIVPINVVTSPEAVSQEM
jgi:hypothetical protein